MNVTPTDTLLVMNQEDFLAFREATGEFEVLLSRANGLGLLKDGHVARKALACLDVIRDSGDALFSYLLNSSEAGPTIDHYLKLYGFLQAAFVQQNALKSLGKIIGAEIRSESFFGAKKIREIRRLVAGHPTDTAKGPHEAFCFIDRTSLSGAFFSYTVHLDNGVTERENVFPNEIISAQLLFAAMALGKLEGFLSGKINQLALALND